LWREATPDDRNTLKDEFLCTDPPRKIYRQGRKQHPREWELDAQSIVKDIRFPLPENNTVLLGSDDEGLAVVCQYKYDPATADSFIGVIAVAWRAQARRYGAAALEYVKSLIHARAIADGHDGYLITARVHEQNKRSQRMCEKHDLVRVKPADKHRLETWALAVKLN